MDISSINITTFCGHVAYFLIFFSFLVKRMLYLRCFAIVASCFSLYYNSSVSGGPLWVPIQWNIIFTIVNIYHVVIIFLQQRKVELNPVEKKIYQSLFSSMTANEFHRFFHLGFTRTYNEGEKIIKQNEELDALFLIVSGSAEIRINGASVTSLKNFKFVGEMSFLTRNKTKADVILAEKSKVHYWDRSTLDSFLAKNPSLLTKLHAAIGTQLIEEVLENSPIQTKSQQKLKLAA